MAASFDALVIGAGAAGLSAARGLSEAGFRVLVVEARTRLGGRILTVHDPEWPLPVELGPEFLHGDATEARRIADTAALAVVERPDVHVWARAGRLRPMRRPWDRFRQVRRRLADSGRERSAGEALGRLRLGAADKRIARLLIEGYHGASVDQVSARWLAGDADEEAADFRQYRMAAGYDRLVRWLTDGLDPRRAEVRLGTVASAVAWRKGEATVTLRRAFAAGEEKVAARAVVVAVPIGVLQAAPGETGAIRFQPDPPALARARKALLSTTVCKLLLRFRDAFWDEPGFFARRLGPGAGVDPGRIDFMHDDRSAFPTWWTANPWRAPVLTAWAGGPAADALAGLEEGALVARAVESLAGMLGLRAREIASRLQSWRVHDWKADPFSRGAYAAVAVGGVAAQRALARPVAGTLYFAGEATDPAETGTVSGALKSGLRAARQARRGLRG